MHFEQSNEGKDATFQAWIVECKYRAWKIEVASKKFLNKILMSRNIAK